MNRHLERLPNGLLGRALGAIRAASLQREIDLQRSRQIRRLALRGWGCLLWLSHKRERTLLKVVAHHIEPGWRGDGRTAAGARVPPEKIKVIGNWADSALITPLFPQRKARSAKNGSPWPLRGGLRRQSRPRARRRHHPLGDDPAAGSRGNVARRSRRESHVRVRWWRRATGPT